MREKPLIIAVDFDGTLCDSCFPKIGHPHLELINRLRQLRQEGNKLILWTCRNDEYLENALAFCQKHHLEFDAINDNLPENKKAFNGHYTRKIYANIYLDDHSLLPESFLKKMPVTSFTTEKRDING